MSHVKQVFDYEAVLKSCSAQEIAANTSNSKRLKDYKMYDQTLEIYKKTKRHFLNKYQIHHNLRIAVNEKLNIENSYLKLQTTPNSKLSSIQEEIRAIYEEMAKDSDDFVNLISDTVKKIENLAAEFDESTIARKRNECTSEIDVFKRKIEDEENKYRIAKKRANSDDQDTTDMIATNKKLKCFNDDSKKLATNAAETEGQMSLVQKNIEFLKQRNYELQVQCDMFD